MDALNIFSACASNLGDSVSRDFYIDMFAYLITQGRGIAERNVEEFRRAVGFSTAKSKKRDRPAEKAGLSVAPNMHAFAHRSCSNAQRTPDRL